MAKRKTAMTVVDVEAFRYPDLYNAENMPPVGSAVTPLNSQFQNMEILEVEAVSWPYAVFRSRDTGKQTRYDLRGVQFVQLSPEYIDAVMRDWATLED